VKVHNKHGMTQKIGTGKLHTTHKLALMAHPGDDGQDRQSEALH